MDVRESLQRIDLFRDLPDAELEELGRSLVERRYASGQLIFGEDEEVRAFYLVVQGRVKIYKGSATGRAQTLYVVEEGEPFCFCTLFNRDSHPVSAAALEPCRLLLLPGEAIQRIALEQPSLLFNIMGVLSHRLLMAMQMIETLSLRGVPGRVASYLLHQAGEAGAGEPHRFRLAVAKQELAHILGTTPETLSRILHGMARDGLIEVRGRDIAVLDREGLAERAGEG